MRLDIEVLVACIDSDGTLISELSKMYLAAALLAQILIFFILKTAIWNVSKTTSLENQNYFQMWFSMLLKPMGKKAEKVQQLEYSEV